MLYSFTNMATVGVKGLSLALASVGLPAADTTLSNLVVSSRGGDRSLTRSQAVAKIADRTASQP